MVRNTGVPQIAPGLPIALAIFLKFVRAKLVAWTSNGTGKVVTYDDLIDMGLVDKASAEKQARK